MGHAHRCRVNRYSEASRARVFSPCLHAQEHRVENLRYMPEVRPSVASALSPARAEFGLMESTLRHSRSSKTQFANRRHRDASGSPPWANAGCESALTIDATVPWRSGNSTPSEIAQSTGRAISLLANHLRSSLQRHRADRRRSCRSIRSGLSGASLRPNRRPHPRRRSRARAKSMIHSVTPSPSSRTSISPRQNKVPRRFSSSERIAGGSHTVGAPGIDGITEFLTPSPGTLRERAGVRVSAQVT